MSIISKIQKLKPQYDRCLRFINKVDVEQLNIYMRNFVYDCFRELRPLSDERKVVASEGISSLIIDDWIGYKFKDEDVSYPVEDRYKFFFTVRMYGRRMKKLVRRPIAEAFASLVDLAVQLVPYENLKFKIDIPATKVHWCCLFNRVYIKPFVVDALMVRPTRLHVLLLLRNGRTSIEADLKSSDSFVILEDIMDYVVQLYSTARTNLMETIEHNYKVMERMKKVILKFKVSE